MTTITITETHPEKLGEADLPFEKKDITTPPVERLKMTLDTHPSPETINQIIALLNVVPAKKRKRRKDAGKPRE